MTPIICQKLQTEPIDASNHDTQPDRLEDIKDSHSIDTGKVTLLSDGIQPSDPSVSNC